MNLDFKKETIKDVAVLGVATLAGSFLSKGLMSIVPSSVKEPMVQGVLSVAGFGVAGAIQGKGPMTSAVKGLLLGVGVENAQGAISGMIAPSLPTEATTKGQKFVKAMFGMNGSEEETYPDYEPYQSSFSLPESVWNDTENSPEPIQAFHFSAI